MTKIIVSADIHGCHDSWLTLKNLLEPNDKLIIAGDLFDTRYGSYDDPDFQPDDIKKDLNQFKHDLYYVYGNCDIESYFPGYHSNLHFAMFDKTIYLHHGHHSIPKNIDADIIIQGHTHRCSLEKKDGTIYMNPGSMTYPRSGFYTYGIIESTGASLVELKTGEPFISVMF
jgi:uncharacterized protein